MKSRWMHAVMLGVIAVIALSFLSAYAIQNITITVPYGDANWKGSACNEDVSIPIRITGTANVDDDAGHDYLAFLLRDGNNTIIDAYIFKNTPLGAFDEENNSTIPSFDDLPDPVSRPFTLEVYDVPFSGLSEAPGSPVRDFVVANGTLLGSSTFDPSFVPGCGALPLAAGTCIDIHQAPLWAQWSTARRRITAPVMCPPAYSSTPAPIGLSVWMPAVNTTRSACRVSICGCQSTV